MAGNISRSVGGMTSSVADERYLTSDVASGVPCIFDGAIGGDAKNFKVYGNSVFIPKEFPIKATSGTQGIFIKNADGTITINGTGPSIFWGMNLENPISVNAGDKIKVLPEFSTDSGISYTVDFRKSDLSVTTVSTSGGEVTVPDGAVSIYEFRLVVESDKTINNVTVAPKVVISSPSPSIPLDIESVGDLVTEGEHAGKYKVEVKVTGERESSVTVYLGEPLRKVGDYADYIDFEKQCVIRKVNEEIVDGTYTWADIPGYNCFATSAYNKPFIKGIAGNDNITSNDASAKWSNQEFNSIQINKDLYGFTETTTKEDVKAYFANRATNGNPLKIWYAMAEPIEESIVIEPLKIHEGDNNVFVATGVQPSGIEVEYYLGLDEAIRKVIENYGFAKSDVYATRTQYGLVKGGGSTFGITVDNGIPSLVNITEGEIKSRGQSPKGIAGYMVDLFVKEGLVNNKLTLTDEEKNKIKAWLGI